MNAGYVSLLVIICFLAILFFCYERTKPSAKDLVLVSTLSAFAIFARVIFSFFPLYNPILAIIMLSGFVLGPFSGFMVGALSALGSNFIFGQGTWTFYQMFGYGISGFVFGYIKKFRFIHYFSSIKDYIFLSLMSFVLIIFFVGPLLDLSGFFMTGMNDWNYLKVILLSGLPFNVFHGLSTVITIVFLGKWFSQTVSRILKKYNTIVS